MQSVRRGTGLKSAARVSGLSYHHLQASGFTCWRPTSHGLAGCFSPLPHWFVLSEDSHLSRASSVEHAIQIGVGSRVVVGAVELHRQVVPWLRCRPADRRTLLLARNKGTFLLSGGINRGPARVCLMAVSAMMIQTMAELSPDWLQLVEVCSQGQGRMLTHRQFRAKEKHCHSFGFSALQLVCAWQP